MTIYLVTGDGRDVEEYAFASVALARMIELSCKVPGVRWDVRAAHHEVSP